MPLSDVVTLPMRARAVRGPAIRLMLFAERLRSGIALDPFDAGFRANPYPLLHELRERDPVHWLDTGRAWFFTRHDDVNALLRDRRCSIDRTPPRYSVDAAWRRQSRIQRILETSVLGLDPPEHTRLRGLVSQAFTPRIVANLDTRIQAIAEELLDALDGRDRFDLAEEFAVPLPTRVIAEMLGAPPGDFRMFRRWSDALGGALDLTFQREPLDRADQAVAEFEEYLRPLIEARRRQPDDYDDLLGALVAAEEGGDQLSEDELYSFCILLLTAGSQTTVHAIGNSALALLRDPAALDRFRSEPGRTAEHVEELLRFDSPVQLTSRRALEPMEIGGRRLRTGDLLVLSLGAANRDPAHFAEPDRLDFAREDNRHLSFAAGPHYCVGSALARLELAAALPRLFERFPGLHLDPDRPPVWADGFVLRGLERLPLRT